MFIGISLNSCFDPGSYPYAETYEMETSEQRVIEAVAKFKMQNPEFIVPSNIGLEDGRGGDSPHWFHIYFYDKENETIIYTWTRQRGENKTTFALIGINEGLELGNWKDVNKDFSRSENKQVIAEFEKNILEEIKKHLEDPSIEL